MATGIQSEGMTARCLRRAFDEVPVGLGILAGSGDRGEQFIDLNRAMADLLDCQPAELLGRSFRDCLEAADSLRYEELANRLQATHQPARGDFRTRAGGEITVSATVVRDPC